LSECTDVHIQLLSELKGTCLDGGNVRLILEQVDEGAYLGAGPEVGDVTGNSRDFGDGIGAAGDAEAGFELEIDLCFDLGSIVVIEENG
jgi:hypothetical protein